MNKKEYLSILLMLIRASFIIIISSNILLAQSGRSGQNPPPPPPPPSINKLPPIQPRIQKTENQKWEYRVLRYQYEGQIEKERNKLGDEGFELILFELKDEIVREGTYYSYSFVAVLRRTKM